MKLNGVAFYAKKNNRVREKHAVPGTGSSSSIVPLCKLSNKTNSNTLTWASCASSAQEYILQRPPRRLFNGSTQPNAEQGSSAPDP